MKKKTLMLNKIRKLIILQMKKMKMRYFSTTNAYIENIPILLLEVLTDNLITHILFTSDLDIIAVLQTHVTSIFHVLQVARPNTQPTRGQIQIISWYESIVFVLTVELAAVSFPNIQI